MVWRLSLSSYVDLHPSSVGLSRLAKIRWRYFAYWSSALAPGFLFTKFPFIVTTAALLTSSI